MKIFTAMIIIFLLAPFVLEGQKVNRLIQEGNSLSEEGNYEAAIEKYKQALEMEPNSLEGRMNLGNAYYHKNDYAAASSEFRRAATLAVDKDVKADAYHNLGNALFRQQDLTGSVDAYKDALRLDPGDNDTRYNLSLAMQKQEQAARESEQDEQDGQDGQDEQDERDGQDGQDEQRDPTPRERREERIDPDQAERILRALGNEDRNIQERLAKEKSRQRKPQQGKDW